MAPGLTEPWNRLAIHCLHAAGITDGAATDDAAFAVYGASARMASPAPSHRRAGARPWDQAIGTGPRVGALESGHRMLSPTSGPLGYFIPGFTKSNIGHTSDTGTVQSVTAQEKNRSAAP